MSFISPKTVSATVSRSPRESLRPPVNVQVEDFNRAREIWNPIYEKALQHSTAGWQQRAPISKKVQEGKSVPRLGNSQPNVVVDGFESENFDKPVLGTVVNFAVAFTADTWCRESVWRMIEEEVGQDDNCRTARPAPSMLPAHRCIPADG